MSIVALQFEENQILVAAARATARRIQVQNLFTVDMQGDDSSVAEALKTELAKHGMSRSDAVVVISRANAEMRELTVPPAPDNEIPDMVRFIARNEFASLNENWALDYLQMSGDASSSRTVLAIGISPEFKKQTCSITEKSGLKIKHMVLRPFASIDLIPTKLSDGKCRLLIDPNGDQTDMTIVDGAALVATRTVRIPEAHDANQRSESMLSEVRRTLASSRKMLGDRTITEVVMFGDADKNKILAGNLLSKLDLNVDFIEPLKMVPVVSGFQQPEHAARFSALLGSLLQLSSNEPPKIDFVNPRRPVVQKSDFSKYYRYGAIALAASLLAVVCGWWILSSQASTISEYQANLDELLVDNKGSNSRPSVDQIIGEVGAIDTWKAADINWLEELYQYSERALTPDDAIVDLFDAEAGLRADATARILINTRITDVQKESDLIGSLGARPFDVKTTRGAVNVEDKDYPLSSSIRISLLQNKRDIIKDFDDRAREYVQKVNAKRMGTSQVTDPESDSNPDAAQ